MLDASARLLQLLSLLQSRRSWQGPELAEALSITERTVRRDIDKLRNLGYPVRATAGVAGGYRMAAGARLPPLLLDDGEALAVAFGLRSAAVGTVTGMEQAALRALDKLGKVLPDRLRKRVNGLSSSFVAAPFEGPRVDPDALVQLVQACEERRLIHFRYRDARGNDSERRGEPLGVAHTLSRWYLVCWDLWREDFRTFRVDRLQELSLQEARFVPKPLPHGDLATYIAESVDGSHRAFQAKVEFLAPHADMVARLPSCAGRLSPIDDQRCLLEAGDQSIEQLAWHLGIFDIDFIVHEPPELVDHLQAIGARLLRAAEASSQDPSAT